MRHFWPDFPAQLDALPDTRYPPMVVYHRRFLLWWGLALFCCKLGSRRQLDYQLRDAETRVLDNLNRLAGCQQSSLPVNQTLSHFLGHVGSAPLARLRTQLVRHLIRNKVLDAARLHGHLVIAVDGTGFLRFSRPHCPHCLVHKQGAGVAYLHPVLEAKLIHPRGLALSVGSEFIENPRGRRPRTTPDPATLTEYAQAKQDCELKAFARLARQLKADFPHTRLWISGDSLYACGPVLTICEDSHWAYTLTFKPGRTPALWADFQGLLRLAPTPRLRCTLPDGTRQCFRWVNDLDYQDDAGRHHTVHALLCEESGGDADHTFAWITAHRLTPANVPAIAAQAGRGRSQIENQGFNTQKNSGLNLEHAYSTHPDILKAFYYLLQIAHLFLQMFEKGSLLQHLAREYAATPLQLFGSLRNLARRLLDAFRYCPLADEDLAPGVAARRQIRLCDSS